MSEKKRMLTIVMFTARYQCKILYFSRMLFIPVANRIEVQMYFDFIQEY